MFTPTTTVQVGFRTRSDEAFDMTKDGFTLLVMGCTGSKAMQFKLARIFHEG
uniref:Uncharacterized protein n=1 Tax=Magnetococcus massalia (strain MO-1) TaxID=451514 RepID=A0A1S7LDD2_MAGMO|nr:protein of unknown function [Candidatus Magnetococcus massalia]